MEQIFQAGNLTFILISRERVQCSILHTLSIKILATLALLEVPMMPSRKIKDSL